MHKDVHDILAAISAVLKRQVLQTQLHQVRATFKPEYIQFQFGADSGYITRRDAVGWGVSLGHIQSALEAAWAESGNPNKFRPAVDGRSMIRGENVDSMKRMMGITPSLMEQVAGITEGPNPFKGLVGREYKAATSFDKIEKAMKRIEAMRHEGGDLNKPLRKGFRWFGATASEVSTFTAGSMSGAIGTDLRKLKNKGLLGNHKVRGKTFWFLKSRADTVSEDAKASTLIALRSFMA